MDASGKTLYDILGVEQSATEEEIVKAYRKLAFETHPDRNGGDNTGFNEVNEAYTILRDRKLRQNYDTTGSTTKKTVDNTRAEAVKELQRVMLQILDESDDEIFYQDLPSHVLNIFNANILKSKNTIVDLKKSIKRLRRYKKRFHYKSDDGNDFILIGINNKVYALTGSIQFEITKIRSFELMLELLASYDYEPEIPQATFGLRPATNVANHTLLSTIA